MSKENFKIYACIVLFGLVGICIKLGTAVSSEIEHERNVSVKVQNFVQNSTMPKEDLKTIELSAADSDIYHVMHRVGNKANKIDAINPYTNREFIGEGRLHPTLPYHPCVTYGTRCWEDRQKLFVWLDEVRKQRSDILNEQG